LNVLADLHHGDLYYSLHLLFEKRLGMTLFRPIGLEWFTKGFWKVAEPYGNAPDTIDQYLGVPKGDWSRDKEPTQRYGGVQLVDGVYHIPTKIGSGEYVQKAITFDKFVQMDFAFVVASHPGHDEAYARLVREHKPSAVYVRQIGDVFTLPQFTRNVLLAINTPMPSNVNYVKYHPEHHEDYSYAPPVNHNVVKSFLTHIRLSPDYQFWVIFERTLPDFMFKMHGIGERDGVISNDLMPQAIKDSAFVWHVKRTGCGGFVSRQALACGRPCIIRKRYCYEYYTLARDLFEDSVNCIDLDLGSINQNIQKIRDFSEPERHTQMCKNTADKFKRDVDFDKEAEKIRAFLTNLLKR